MKSIQLKIWWLFTRFRTRKGDKPGGLISGRLKEFPSHDSTSNAHSLTQSQKDGHIFITPSAQRRLIEFDPKSKAFIIHQYEEGFYPHTIRMDAKDNVWFTLALSNQVAKFDRTTSKFTMYDLPARSFKEKLITKNIGFLFKIMSWGIPLSNWLKIDRESSGTPLLYGIDVTPDGKVWFARLHTREIGNVDPDTGKITMIPTPFDGPRRLRTDSSGNLWIVAFGESKIAKYDPKTAQFTMYDLPVNPKGSDTPYALNVDLKRNVVWATGNQSDALYGFDIKSEKWMTIPLPRRVTFTRDVEIDEDGTLYTSNSNFPSWHIEGAQPTLIQVRDFKF
jgi:virginiamycin B lyase